MFEALSLFLLVLPCSASVPTISGWTLGFHDDFNGNKGTLPSSKNWLFDIGTQYPGGPAQWGTGEIETYTNNTQNIALSGNGELYITPIRTSSGWTSARIESINDSIQTAKGHKLRIQASIAMPNVNQHNGLGYWPAFWALGAPFRTNGSEWPMIGEFDIMENVNGLNFAAQTMHCGTNPGGPCNEPNGIGSEGLCSGSACQGNFHTYTLIVDRSTTPEIAIFYVDGVQNRNISESSLPTNVWTAAVDRPNFILLNVAMGGAYPNGVAGMTTPTTNTTSGVPMIVDYVGVWHQ